MRRRRTILIVSAAAAAIAAAVTLVVVWLGDWPAYHFSVVREGILYRGGQPTGQALEHIIARYKIKTVVNVRGSYPQQDWWQVERDTCRKHGLRMVDVPVGSHDTVVSGLKQFLAIATDSANAPVYVHCEAGSARTGYAVAAYRIVAQGWSYDQAIQEATKFRFNPRVKLNDEWK